MAETEPRDHERRAAARIALLWFFEPYPDDPAVPRPPRDERAEMVAQIIAEERDRAETPRVDPMRDVRLTCRCDVPEDEPDRILVHPACPLHGAAAVRIVDFLRAVHREEFTGTARRDVERWRASGQPAQGFIETIVREGLRAAVDRD